MSRRRFGLWPGGKQSSKPVRRSVAKVPGGTVVHSSTQTPGSAPTPGGGGITCHIRFSQRSRRWPMWPRGPLRPTQQVLTSRLSSAALGSIPPDSRVSLGCTHTAHIQSLSSQAPRYCPLICWPVSRGSGEDCCWDVGKLKGAWDISLPQKEPRLPYSCRLAAVGP